jgi:hypothetical protein
MATFNDQDRELQSLESQLELTDRELDKLEDEYNRADDNQKERILKRVQDEGRKKSVIEKRIKVLESVLGY